MSVSLILCVRELALVLMLGSVPHVQVHALAYTCISVLPVATIVAFLECESCTPLWRARLGAINTHIWGGLAV